MDIKFSTPNPIPTYALAISTIIIVVFLIIGQLQATEQRKAADAQIQLDRIAADNKLRDFSTSMQAQVDQLRIDVDALKAKK
jgi:spore coat protein CotH